MVRSESRVRVEKVNPSWTTPACASVHCWPTPTLQNTLRKQVVYSMSHNFCISPQISCKLCVYTGYIIRHYTLF